MPLREIAQFIEDNTSWQIGVDFFVGHLPPKTDDGEDPPVRCVVLLENTPGAVEGQLPDRIDKPVQIWNRAQNYTQARDDAYEFYNLLHGTHGWNLPVLTSGEEYLAMTVDAIGTPAPIQNPDERGRFVFSTNYLWRIEEGQC